MLKPFPFPVRLRALFQALGAGLVAAFALPGSAGEFSVTPIRLDLRGGAMNETVTVINHGKEKLRISVKLAEWTQDASGQDIYKESSDLIFFPRQLEVEPEGRRLVRVGARTPAGLTERAYRVFLEEEPEASAVAGRSQVAFLFRFGVPVFLPPALPKAVPEVMEPTLERGKLSLVVRNSGNQHFRLTRLVVGDGAGFSQEITGWYSLAGTQRTYSADVPVAVCRQARKLTISIEGEEGIRLDRQLDVDPARCA